MKPYYKNPRKINDKQLSQLEEWLAELGDLSGIVHDLNSDEIIGGNQRGRIFDINRCKVVITEELPAPDEQGTVAWGYVVWRGHKYQYRQVRWTPEQCEKANIVANQAGGVFDFEKLATWDLGDLLEWGFEAGDLNFDAPTPAGTGDAEPQTDRVAALQELWQTERGQLWAIGEHRLLCGDCTVREDVERVMGGEAPALIIADPPYGVNIVAANGYVGGGESANGMIPFGGVKNRKKGHVGGGEGYRLRHGHYAIEERKKSKRLGSANGAKPFGSKAVRGSDGAANLVDVGKYAPIIGDETTETAKLSSSLLLEMYPKAVHSWWGANYYTDALAPSPCWLVWNKETTGNFADCELAWTNQDKAAKLFTHRWNGMLRDSERERRWHPTQKPAALALWVIQEFAIQGAVFDPFAGAGWSMIAAENAGIKARCMELSAEYCAVILQRMADAFPHLEIYQLP